MAEVTNVVSDDVGEKNISSNLDSNNTISAAATNGDRERSSGRDDSDDDVSRRSSRKKDRKHRDRSRSRSRERSHKHKRRHRSRDRKRSKSRDDSSDDDYEKDRGSRDRKSSRRDRDRDRDRERRRSRDRDRERRHSRDRDRSRRDRDRDRDRDRRRSRSSSRDRRRREQRERDRSEERRAERRREREAERERKEKEDQAAGRVTLKDVLSQNPGISVQDALQRMHAINTALATGATVPPISVAPNGQNPFLGGATGVAAALQQGNPQAQFAATKSQREIYVGNIPPGITIPQLTEFVNEAMKQLGLAQPSPFGGPVMTCWISTDAHYAFVEFRTVEEAAAALTGLSGVSCAGYQLRVGRPKTSGQQAVGGVGIVPGQPLGVGQVVAPTGGFGVGVVPSLTPTLPGTGGAATGGEVTNVLMVANLPDSIGEAQVRELLGPFGKIKLFNFIKLPTGGSAAVLEYEDGSVAESAITGLNGLGVGDKQLSVQRVPPNMTAMLLKPATQTTTAPTPAAEVTKEESGDSDVLLKISPTPVLRLSNMTNEEELADNELYEELQEDIADECNKHGTVRSIVIPRRNEPGVDSAAVGEVFVCFTHSEAAERTRQAVHGRTFNGLSVKAVFYPEDLFHAKVYVLPEGYDVNKPPRTGESTDEVMD